MFTEGTLHSLSGQTLNSGGHSAVGFRRKCCADSLAASWGGDRIFSEALILSRNSLPADHADGGPRTSSMACRSNGVYSRRPSAGL